MANLPSLQDKGYILWYTDGNITESPLPYSPRPYTPSDHPQTPPRPEESTPTPEPQQISKKRSRSPEPWQGYQDLEDLFNLTPEITRDLEFLGESSQKKQRLDPDLYFP